MVVARWLHGHGYPHLTTARVYAHARASDKVQVAEKWQAAMQRAAGSKVVEMPLKKKQA